MLIRVQEKKNNKKNKPTGDTCINACAVPKGVRAALEQEEVEEEDGEEEERLAESCSSLPGCSCSLRGSIWAFSSRSKAAAV